jgi:polysaccharide biosynthesis protein PslH
MDVLFLSRWFPYPPDNGAKIRIHNLLQALADVHRVDLVSFSSHPVEDSQLDFARSICHTVDTFLYRPYQPNRVTAFAGFFSRQPRFLVDTYHPELAKIVENKCETKRYDLVIASQLDMLPYLTGIESTATILEELEISQYLDAISNESSYIASFRRRLTWLKLSAFLKYSLSQLDGVTTVSEIECKRILKNLRPKKNVQVIPNCVNVKHTVKDCILPQRDSLIYAGALTYAANFHAVDHFLRNIYPKIQEMRPGVTFTVTGSLEGVDLTRLPKLKGVIFRGYVEDIAAAVAGSWASVVPLQIGGGTRLKILESLSLGTPVISTSKGAEGLDLMPGQDLLIEDNPQRFAEQVVRVLEDEVLRNKLGQTGRQSVAEKYDWQKVGAVFRNYAENVVKNRTVGTGG